ncbi:MAG TPA: alpha/beta hydrolase [Anaeromyxobacteraceae bacterium]|nr:alpha/beta hydrolase [Anaeromyxobacteraceae bacterium]
MTRGRPLAPEGTLDVDGARLEYRFVRAARAGLPALVFLHEGLGSVSLWRDFPDEVARRTGCAALIYSRAGYGRSSPVPVPRPLTYMHDEGLRVLPRLLDAARLGDVALVGHSDGASIALVHAGGADPAGRVRCVVALAPHVFCEELSVASIAKARDAYQRGDLRSRLARHHGENVDVAFWGWNRAWLDPDFMRWNIEKYLPEIRVPVLVVQGKDDEYGTAAQVRAVAAGCGGPTRVLVLDSCGHSPHRDQREATAAAVSEFLAGVCHANPGRRPRGP